MTVSSADERVVRSDRSDVAWGWRLVDAAIVVKRLLTFPSLRPALPYLLMLPALGLVALFVGGLVDLVWSGFHSYDAFRGIRGPVSLDQYRRLFTGPAAPHFWHTIRTTVTLSIAVTLTALVIALPLSYFMLRIRSRPWRLIAMTLLLVPFLMGEIVRAFGWYILLGRDGVLAWIGTWFGADNVNLLGTGVAVWLGMLPMTVPTAVLVLMPSLKHIGQDLEQAAMTLGARPISIWRHVIVPLARPGLAAAATVVFSLSMTEFAVPQVLGLGRLPFVANDISTIFFFQSNPYLGSALATALLVLVLIGVLLITSLGFGRGGKAARRG